LETHSQLLLRRDGQQQQYWHQQHQQHQRHQQQQRQEHQEQQHHHHPEQQTGVGSLGSASPALSFGGLSFDECRSVFLSPNARRPTAQASLATAFCAAAASHAAALSIDAAAPLAATSTAAAAAADFSVASFPNAAAVSSAGLFNAAFPNASAARQLPVKRAREDYGGLLVSSRAGSGWASRTLHHSQSLEDHFQQQGGESSGVQAALWSRVGSESALPDDVLLGFSSEDPSVSVPFAALPAPLPAALSAQAALPAPLPAPLPVPLPTQLTAPTGSVPRGIRSCLGGTLSFENGSAGQEMFPFMGARSTVPENDPLFLDTPVALLWLHGTASYLPTEPSEASEASEPQGRPLAAWLPDPALPEWALEQGGTREKGGQEHKHQHPVGEEVGVEGVSFPQRHHQQQQLNGHQHLEFEGIPSMSSYQPLPEPHPQPLPELLPQALGLAPSQALVQAFALAPSLTSEQALALAPSQALEQAFGTGTVTGPWSNQY
ncbi:hypothetical protein CLOP_g13151, partial [Closterium sp. NIES-67]